MKLIFIAVGLFCVQAVLGQEKLKSLDFVVVINEDVQVTSLRRTQIIIVKDSVETSIDVNYHPGSLELPGTAYSDIMAHGNDSVFLEFHVDHYVKDDVRTVHYKIPLKRAWLEELYIVLTIYDLSVRKYRKWYGKRHDTRQYVFELDSPSHTFRIVRNR